MSINAAAEALASEIAAPVLDQPTPTEPTQDTPMSEDDLLGQAFDQLNAPDDAEPVEAEAVEEPEQPDPEATAEPEEPEADDEPEAKTSAPSDLPRGVREAWGDIPENAREAIASSHRELTAKLGQQGRQLQGIAPIKDVLTEAIQNLPQMADMTPQQVAKEVFALAQLSHDFVAKPVDTLMGYIKQHGLQEQMAAALSGQQAPQAAQQVQSMAQHIRKLESRLEQLSDPNYIRGQVSQYTTETQMQDTVSQFAAKADHWEAVEDRMPVAISLVQAKLGDGASPQDVLSQAYELAVSQFVPEAKATTKAAEQAAVTVDPEKTKAQLRAKSANVKSAPASRSKPKSEDQLLAETFDKLSK